MRSPWRESATFRDRADAGRRLADEVAARLGDLEDDDPVIEALPRGGVPVGFEVARRLGAPLDVILVRKLGLPYQPELAMGAIGEGDVRVLDADLLARAGVSADELAVVDARERAELQRRGERYRGGLPHEPMAGRVVVIVDDGLATGSTAKAACEVARAAGAARVVLAVPVAPPDWQQRLGGTADEYVCVATPEPFHAVGQAYDDFSATSDREVVSLLRIAARARGARTSTPSSERGAVGGGPERRELEMPVAVGSVSGTLVVPPSPAGLVVFAHGSGSSRHSPRNRYVAEVLHEGGLATFLFDLLTEHEEQDRRNVFDVDLLAHRLADAIALARAEDDVARLPVGLFGASTGAAAALLAAAAHPDVVGAVVSRGGRPDLAGDRLPQVVAPTLLLVGGEDEVVLELNRSAAARLGGPHELRVVPGAGHLFSEPGTLEVVALSARDWFQRHLGPPARSA